MSTPFGVHSMLDSLSMHDMAEALPHATFSHAQMHSQAKMEDTVFLLPEEQQVILEETVCRKRMRLKTKLIPSVHLAPSSQMTFNPTFKTVSSEIHHATCCVSNL